MCVVWSAEELFSEWVAGPAQKHFPLEHVTPLLSEIWKAKTISDVRIALFNNSYRDC